MEMRNDEMKSIKYNVMKVAIYIRVSTEDQAKEGYSLEVQREYPPANFTKGKIYAQGQA